MIEEYVTAGGANLVLRFVSGLARQDQVEAIALLKLLAERGNTLGMPHSKALGKGLFELRGQQVRLFYIFRPDRRIVLLDGLVKKRGDIPAAAVARLRGLAAEVKAREVTSKDPAGKSET
ncbi:MAG: type II toxin-antitoxin system RelE/ParE family toxin [candidate division NC10 bacterium]|nr:type II toxin-antitoxin system RelE/ParE family toxin [candidate division NC10 bacterium]MBI4390440.1 type II toxin-antitoxin system RelE/ParE family toxin [candidate division NC10 bacterium]